MTEMEFYPSESIELSPEYTTLEVQPRYGRIEMTAPGPQGPRGPAGVAGGSRYIHTQTNPALVWVVQHDLGYEPLFATVVVDDEDVSWAVDIVHAGVNTLTVQFSQAESGKAAFL